MKVQLDKRMTQGIAATFYRCNLDTSELASEIGEQLTHLVRMSGVLKQEKILVSPKSSFNKQQWTLTVEDDGRTHSAQISNQRKVSEFEFDDLLQFLGAYLVPAEPF